MTSPTTTITTAAIPTGERGDRLGKLGLRSRVEAAAYAALQAHDGRPSASR